MKTVWEIVDRFEELVAEYAGSKYAVAVDSCSNALFLSLKLCQYFNISTIGSTIQIPSRTYISVPMQVIHSGHLVEFNNDPWEGTYQLGSLPVIDSAQRFTEGMYTNDTLYCLSFHSKKILSIGRGGMVLTNNSEHYEWLKRSRYDGREKIYYNDISNQTVPTLGWHMYMTPEEATRGIEQLYKTPKVNLDSGRSGDYAIDLSTLSCLKTV
tara:strand:- start:442 stop:1074 length:633 start_codon:yes stop_codon:yes gene_type:complete